MSSPYLLALVILFALFYFHVTVILYPMSDPWFFRQTFLSSSQILAPPIYLAVVFAHVLFNFDFPVILYPVSDPWL